MDFRLFSMILGFLSSPHIVKEIFTWLDLVGPCGFNLELLLLWSITDEHLRTIGGCLCGSRPLFVGQSFSSWLSLKQVPMSLPMKGRTDSDHRWSGIPCTLIQKKSIKDGKELSDVPSDFCRTSIHLAKCAH